MDAFLGIPYAAPPVGELRFEKPQPAPAWAGVYGATSKPSPCWQLDLTLFENAVLNYSSGSEDCLYVNVWRPASACPVSESCDAGLPVIVFVHGGAFQWGDSSLFFYDPSNFVALSDVVFVTFNYRVGIFGFLSAETSELPGNMGLWDQNMLLKWVRNNIKHFGGNPNDVTLSGQSAGGIAAGMHAVSSYSKGLFKRLIMQSGTPLSGLITTSYKPSGQFVTVASALGCYDSGKNDDVRVSEAVACLKKLSAPSIMSTLREQNQLRQLFPPVHGDDFLPNDPLAEATWKEISAKEILLGTTLDEGTLFFDNMRRLAPQAASLLSGGYRITVTIGLKTLFNIPFSDGKRIVEAYFGDGSVDHDRATLVKLFCDVFTDALFHCPALYFADLATGQGISTYRYIFAHRAEKTYWPEWMGVVHGADIPYTLGSLVFDRDESKLTAPVGKEIQELLRNETHTAEDVDFMKQVVSSWTAFITKGVPSIPSRELEWPKHDLKDSSFLYLQPSNYSEAQESRRSFCDLWRPYLLKKDSSSPSVPRPSQAPPVKESGPKKPTPKPTTPQKRPSSTSAVHHASHVLFLPATLLTICFWRI